MGLSWREHSFAELCDITRGASPRPIHEWISAEGVPWIKISDASATKSRTISHTRERIRSEGRTKSVPVFPGDLIVSNSATPGIPKFVGIDACIHDGWLLLRNFRGIDRVFCYYLLVAERSRIVRQGTGSVFTNLKTDILKKHRVRIPPLPEQLAIIHLLGSLDDKIELNRRMNETLEAMARAIFKDWFVDFGPTRAKAEGGEPYLAPALWDLFPDALDDEDKPVGWSVCPVSELFEFNPRESVKKGTYTPYLNMAALPTSGAAADAPIHREYKSGSKFRDGDSLFARITPCLENGKTAYVFDMGNGIVGTGSTEFIVIRSRTPLPAPASYFLARDPEFRDHAERSMTGTSGRQRASREALSQYELATPTDDQLWKALGDFVTPMMDRVIANARESRVLARTRNLLLPKLMSGEIRLGEAEKAMEAVI